MALDHNAAKRVLAQIDRDELAELGCQLASIASPTGREKAIAEFILAWFEGNGLKAVRQDVELDRPNAVGILKGDGSGLSLGFNGHTDTSFTGTSDDLRMVANIEPETELRGRIVRLKGDVIFAAVVGEISRTPIGPWQGQEYRGEGVGTRHLLSHGMYTDYAVVADGSDMNIVWTQTGVVQVKITTFGKAEAAWGTKRSDYPMEKMNAIVKMTRIIAALEQWGEDFEERYIYDSPTGALFPKVNIGAIEGGAPYRPNYFPGVCSIYVDVRMPPQVRPLTIKHEIEQTLAKLDLDYELDVYKSLLGHEGKNVEPLVACAQEVYQHLFGEKIKPESPDRASIWTDTNIYNELGIPAIKIGPRGRRISARNEEIEIDAMMKAARLYALMALDICSRERKR